MRKTVLRQGPRDMQVGLAKRDAVHQVHGLDYGVGRCRGDVPETGSVHDRGKVQLQHIIVDDPDALAKLQEGIAGGGDVEVSSPENLFVDLGVSKDGASSFGVGITGAIETSTKPRTSW